MDVKHAFHNNYFIAKKAKKPFLFISILTRVQEKHHEQSVVATSLSLAVLILRVA